MQKCTKKIRRRRNETLGKNCDAKKPVCLYCSQKVLWTFIEWMSGIVTLQMPGIQRSDVTGRHPCLSHPSYCTWLALVSELPYKYLRRRLLKRKEWFASWFWSSRPMADWPCMELAAAHVMMGYWVVDEAVHLKTASKEGSNVLTPLLSCDLRTSHYPCSAPTHSSTIELQAWD